MFNLFKTPKTTGGLFPIKIKCEVCNRTIYENTDYIWKRKDGYNVYMHHKCYNSIDSDCLRCRWREKDGFYYGGDCTSGDGEKIKGFEPAWICRAPYRPRSNPDCPAFRFGDAICGINIDLDTVQGLIEIRKWAGYDGDNCPYFKEKEGL